MTQLIAELVEGVHLTNLGCLPVLVTFPQFSIWIIIFSSVKHGVRPLTETLEHVTTLAHDYLEKYVDNSVYHVCVCVWGYV